MSEPIEFLASIAPLDSAIQVSSHGGCRVKIDIPESEMPAIIRLMLMRGMTLRITMGPARDAPGVDLIKRNASAKRKQPQSAWAPAEKPGADDDA